MCFSSPKSKKLTFFLFVPRRSFQQQMLPEGFPTSTRYGFCGETADSNQTFVSHSPGPTLVVESGTAWAVKFVNELTESHLFIFLCLLGPIDTSYYEWCSVFASHPSPPPRFERYEGWICWARPHGPRNGEEHTGCRSFSHGQHANTRQGREICQREQVYRRNAGRGRLLV